MPLTITLSLNVTPLADNSTVFSNAAAWNDYFNNLTGDAELDPITVTGYTTSPYDTALTPHDLTVDAVQYVFPTLDMHNSMLAKLNALNNNYVALRGELYAAGLISAP